MARKKRKRSQTTAATTSHLLHLATTTGGVVTTNSSTLENCLEELEGRMVTAEAEKKQIPLETRSRDKNESKKGSYQPSEELRNRIASWNASFQTWIHQGVYSTGLLPSFDVELARHFQVKDLSSFLLESCSNLKMPSFERWLIDSKLEEKREGSGHAATGDPILSGTVTLQFESSQRLMAEIMDASNADREAATRIVRELCRRTVQTALPEVQAQTRRYGHKTPWKRKGGDRILFLQNTNDSVSLVYQRKRWKKPFGLKLNRSHYDKLRRMFLQVHNSTTTGQIFKLGEQPTSKPTQTDHSFHLIVMVLILRYSSLSGGQLLDDLRGGGMQGAVHDALFGVLSDTFSHRNTVECFASPFNANLLSYHSAFWDTDWHFGSRGDFLENNTALEGCWEANPPFSPGFMDAMAERFERALRESTAKETALAILVIVPTADANDSSTPSAKRFSFPSFHKMISSAYCRMHIVLPAREHGYVEGAQHMRPTQYKDSNYDTSVILLQSVVALKQTLNKKRFEKRIRDVFASRHTDELEKRRQGSHGRENG